MGQENFYFTKDSFEVHTSTILENLWNYKNFTDITLATTDKKELKLHQVIISSASKLFKNLLQTNSNETEHVIVNDIKYKYLEMVFKFMSLGRCDLDKEDISEFLATGKALGVSDLNIEYMDQNAIKEDHVVFESCCEDIKSGMALLPTITEPEKELVNTLVKADSDNSPRVEANEGNNIKVIHKKKRVGKFSCRVCGSLFLQLVGLNQHIKSKHEGKTYDCDQCDYKPTQPGNLISHKKAKHWQTKHKCSQCEFQTNWASGVRRHKLSVHDKLRYGCDSCDHSNTKLESLSKHKMSYHSGLVYTCNRCDFTTLSPDMLKSHKFLEHQPIALECDLCHFKSSQENILENHIKYTHGLS